MTRDYRLVVTSLFFWGLAEGLFFSFIPLYLDQFGADAAQIGVILGLAAAAMTATYIPGGALTDRFGPRRVMVAAWFSGLGSITLMFLAPTLPLYVAGLVMYHFTAFVSAPLSRYVTVAGGEWSIARALTTSTAVFNAGSVLGPLLGGLLAEQIGLRNVYGVATGCAILSTSIFLLASEQAVEPHAAQQGYGVLLHNRALVRLLSIGFLAAVSMSIFLPLTPNFLQDVRHVSLSRIGLLSALASTGMVVASLILGRMAARPAYLITQVLVAGSALLLWLGTGMPWFAVGYFLAGSLRTSRALLAAMAAGLVERSRLGLTYGLTDTMWGLGWIVSSALDGLLYDRSPALPFPVSLVLIGIALMATSLLGPHPPKALESPDSVSRLAPIRRE